MSPYPDTSEVWRISPRSGVSFIGRYVRHIRPVGDLAPAVIAVAWVLPIFPVKAGAQDPLVNTLDP